MALTTIIFSQFSEKEENVRLQWEWGHIKLIVAMLQLHDEILSNILIKNSKFASRMKSLSGYSSMSPYTNQAFSGEPWTLGLLCLFLNSCSIPYLCLMGRKVSWYSSRQMHPKFLSFGRVIENNSRIIYIRTHGATQHLERKNLKPTFISIFYNNLRVLRHNHSNPQSCHRSIIHACGIKRCA